MSCVYKVKSLSHVWLLVTPWTAAYQATVQVGAKNKWLNIHTHTADISEMYFDATHMEYLC